MSIDSGEIVLCCCLHLENTGLSEQSVDLDTEGGRRLC